MIDYEELRALARAATAGPWETCEEIDGVYTGWHTVVRTAYHAEAPFGPRRIVTVDQTRQHVRNQEANVAFIAAANPETVLRLMEIIDELDNWEPGDFAKVTYTDFDGYETVAYVNYSEVPNYAVGTNKHTDEPVILRCDLLNSRWTRVHEIGQ